MKLVCEYILDIISSLFGILVATSIVILVVAQPVGLCLGLFPVINTCHIEKRGRVLVPFYSLGCYLGEIK